MSKKIFVGGLPYTITSAQLEEVFAKFGKVVSCEVITDRYSGQSKGFAFVEMGDDKEADEAISKLNETELEGRKIVVNVARPREERPRRSHYASGYTGASQGRDSFGGPRRDFGRRPYSPRPGFQDRSSGPHFPTSRLADDGKKDFGR